MKKKSLLMFLMMTGTVLGDDVVAQKIQRTMENSFKNVSKTSEQILDNKNKLIKTERENKKIEDIKKGDIDKEMLATPDIIKVKKREEPKWYEHNFKKKSKTIIIKENNIDKQQEIIKYAKTQGYELREINNGNLVFKRKE